jgi:hypothetical protein
MFDSNGSVCFRLGWRPALRTETAAETTVPLLMPAVASGDDATNGIRVKRKTVKRVEVLHTRKRRVALLD